jgi:putative endonuclease
MAFVVYIIYSKSINQYYIGHTQDIIDRLYRHNNSGSKSTKKASDWELVYTESYPDKSSAYSREMEIKKKKSRKYIETIVNKKG